MLVGVGCGVGFAALALWVQTASGTPLREVSWGAPLGVLAIGLVLGGGAWFIDSGEARTTLLELEAEGSPPGGPGPEREYDLRIEHPGVEHRLWLNPLAEQATESERDPVELLVRVADPAGRELVAESLVLEAECPDVVFCEWADWSTSFTPPTDAVHRLSVTVLTPDVPLVHIKVDDPEKTDGERLPGY